jgi:proline dehydrogenase
MTEILYKEKTLLFSSYNDSSNNSFDIKKYLTTEQSKQYDNLLNRIESIIQVSLEKKIKLFFDAEQYDRQFGIHYILIELMKKYNQDKCILFNTYQCYLKETNEILYKHLDFAKKNNFKIGAKIVRGAYVKF